MHALLAHAYHLAQYGLHVLAHPLWRPALVALAVASAARLAGLARGPRMAAVSAGVAVLAGWLTLGAPLDAWPLPPVARLPGLALVVLAEAWLLASLRPRAAWLVAPVAAALAAWWLRGAPAGVEGVLGCVPVALGLAAALPLARLLARGDAGWGGAAAALALAAGLLLSGAAAHWARAALVPAAAALALLGCTEAAGALAGAVVAVAAAAMVASDRGRILAVDAACLAPLLAWGLVGRLGLRGPAWRPGARARP